MEIEIVKLLIILLNNDLKFDEHWRKEWKLNKLALFLRAIFFED